MSQVKMTDAEMKALYDRAVAAGRAAANACVPTPMVVTQYANPFDTRSAVMYRDVVNDGVCGFAWVVVRPGTSRFARWLKKNHLARTGYGGGVHIWISDYNQSMERKQAHARAMASVLTMAGIDAYYDSRMD